MSALQKKDAEVVRTRLTAALQYAALGWSILPVKPGSKVPLIERWQERASSDPATIREWFQQHPKAGIGVHCGLSGLVVVDNDPRNGGNETLARLQAERGYLWSEGCAIARTGGGGDHFVFAEPEGVRLPGKLGPGVDLLHGDRYYVVAPTKHPVTGKAYNWDDGANPLHTGDLPVLPEAWRTPLDASSTTDAADGEALATLGPDHLEDTPVNRARLASALDALSSDVDYHEWMRRVFAILATGLPDAVDLARDWSATSDRFDDRSFDTLVNSYQEERRRGGDLIGPGTLFFLAKQAGWTDPGKTAKGDMGRRFEAIPAHEFAKAVHVSWLVRDLLQRDGLGVIFGEAGSGKSFFVLDLSKAVAGGNEWRGLTVTPGRVVYVAAEGASGFRKRLQALAVDQGVPLEGLPLAVIADAPNFLTDDDKAVAEAVQSSGGAVLIVVDTLASVTPGGNENSGEDMGEVIARCKRLQSETGAFVLLVHHSGKDAARGARGWSGLRAAVDVEIEVTRIGDDRLAKVTKQKDSEDGGQFPFRLKTVHLGPDMEGNQSTSCVVEHLDDVPVAAGDGGKPRRPKGKNQRIVFEVIEKFAPCSVDDVLATGAKHMIQDPEKKIDKRRDYARQALESLIAGQFVKQGSDGLIRLYGDTASDWDTEESDAVNAFEGDFA